MKQQLLNLEKKHSLLLKKSAKNTKKIREANAKKQKNKASLIDNRTQQQLKDDDFISLAPENKTSSFIDERTYQQLKDDDFISLEGDEEVKKITDVHKKQKQKQKTETIKEIKKFSANKNKTIAANKTLKKYKNMKKKTKKTYSVNEEDLGTIGYSEPEDLFQGESILNAANKVLDFNEFKKQQEEAIKYFKQFNEKDKNKNKRKALEKEEQIIEIIKVPKKRKITSRQSGTNSSKKNIKKVQKRQISLMEDNKKNFKKARSIFNKLKTDPSSPAFAEEILDKKLLLKLKKIKVCRRQKIF